MGNKAIVISVQPKWVELEINKIKKLEIRKKFCYKWALKQIKENGGFYVYIYATKKGSLTIYNSWNKTLAGYTKKYIKHNNNVAGSVIGGFWCDKVEEIYCKNHYEQEIDLGVCVLPYTKTLSHTKLLEKSCLENDKLNSYLKIKHDKELEKVGYAIHIGDIKIFDVSRDIKKFKHTKFYRKCKTCPYRDFEYKCRQLPNCSETLNLKRAPQNWCYVEE